MFQTWMTDLGSYKFGEITENSINFSTNSYTSKYKVQHWNNREANYNYTNVSSSEGTVRIPYSGSTWSAYAMVGRPSARCQVGYVRNSKGESVALQLNGSEAAIMDYLSREWQKVDRRRFLSHNGVTYLWEIPTTVRADDSTNLLYPTEYSSIKGNIFPFIGRAPNDESYSITEYSIIILDSNCSSPELKLPNTGGAGFNPPPNFVGIASPPPPKKMNCCDCNTIATIIESQLVQRDKLFEDIKNHIDQRIKEEIAIHAKQLEALEIDLQPIIDRINESENNLWNGPKR